MSRAVLALGRVACKHSVSLESLEGASRHRAARVGSFRFSLVLLLTGYLGGFLIVLESQLISNTNGDW
jgi:hypothetical protein